VINRETGDCFYAYVNNFRIREFCNDVEVNRYPNYTDSVSNGLKPVTEVGLGESLSVLMVL